MFKTMHAALSASRRYARAPHAPVDHGKLVKRVIESPSTPGENDYDLGGAGWWGSDNLIHGIHLTDDPSHVEAVLKEGTPLAEGRTRREKYGRTAACGQDARRLRGQRAGVHRLPR